MSGLNNNLRQRQRNQPRPPPRGFWWFEEASVGEGPLSNYSNRVVRQVIYGSPFSNASHGDRRSLSGTWVQREGRIAAGPLSGFPSFLLPILDEVMARGTSYSPRNSTLAPPVESTGEEGNNSILFQDEQNKVLKNLRREIYNPVPKKLTKRVSQYYKDGVSGSSLNNKAKQDDEDEDEKRCAICLDDFEAKQLVILTPCDHMFHEDCIVPWVKIHGRCPICRSTI